MPETAMELIVVVDHNDGDYEELRSPVKNADVNRLRPLFDAIKTFEPYKAGIHTHEHNFPWGDCLRRDLEEKCPETLYPEVGEEVIEWFATTYAPWLEYGFHTISSVTLRKITVVSEEKLI